MSEWERMVNEVVVHGRPADVQSAALGWEQLVRHLGQVRDNLKTQVRDLEAGWKGEAYKAFAGHLEKIATNLDGLVNQVSGDKNLPAAMKQAAAHLSDAQAAMPIPATAINEVMAARNGSFEIPIAGDFFKIKLRDGFFGAMEWTGIPGAMDWFSETFLGYADDARRVYNQVNGDYKVQSESAPESGGPAPPRVSTTTTTPNLGGLPPGASTGTVPSIGAPGGIPGAGAPGGVPAGGGASSPDFPGTSTGTVPGGPGTGTAPQFPGTQNPDFPDGSGLAGAGPGLGAPGIGPGGIGGVPGGIGGAPGGIGGPAGGIPAGAFPGGRPPGGGALGRPVGTGVPPMLPMGTAGAGAGGGRGSGRGGGMRGLRAGGGRGLGGGVVPGGGAGAGGGRGAGRAGAGRGGRPGVMGTPMGHGSGSGSDEHDTWLTEDEDVWGGSDGAPPPVLGG